MKILNTIILFLIICVLTGCTNESKIDPRIVELDSSALITLEEYDFAGGGSLEEFSIYLSKNKVGKGGNIFLNKGGYKGYVAALIPLAFDNSGVGVVFKDGAVFNINGKGFKQLEPVIEGVRGLELVAAARINGELLAFGRDESLKWAFYSLEDDKWVENKMPLPMLGVSEIAIAEIVEYDNRPVVFWRELVGRQVEPGMRMAQYIGGEWEVLPELPASTQLAGGFAVCSNSNSILLIQDSGAKDGEGVGGMPLYEYTSSGEWRALADVPFSKESMARGGFGIDIKSVDGKYVVARADAEGVQVYYSVDIEDGIWKGMNDFEKEEVGIFERINTEEILNYVLIVASVLLIFVFFRRKKKLQDRLKRSASGSGSTDGNNVLETMVKQARIQRIGGFASIIDRGFALLIDGFFVMPVPFYYLDAQNMDIMDSVFTVKELMLFFMWLGSIIIYTTIAEMIFGQTVGKAIARIRVRNLTGGKAKSYQILIRNFARIIDFFPIPFGEMRIWYLIAVISSSVTPRRQRIGDLLAKTVVRRYTPLAKRKIVLASASPRRKELLEEYGLEFDITPADIDENVPSGVTPRDVAKILATQKADSVARKLYDGEVVIGADTIVAIGDEILGKPVDKDDGLAMLRSLSGNTHQVITGVSIIDTATKQLIAAVEVTEVEFRELSESEIIGYVESGEGEDKAGGYAIQGSGGLFVKATLGSTSNVIGMPIELFKRMLADLDAS